jgi:hypothetical protein
VLAGVTVIVFWRFPAAPVGAMGEFGSGEMIALPFPALLASLPLR